MELRAKRAGDLFAVLLRGERVVGFVNSTLASGSLTAETMAQHDENGRCKRKRKKQNLMIFFFFFVLQTRLRAQRGGGSRGAKTRIGKSDVSALFGKAAPRPI